MQNLKDICVNGIKAVVIGAAEWSTERKSAGKLTFRVLKDEALSFTEGDVVAIDGVFFGYVFSKSRDKEGIISVTAYDQMVYLAKNKDTIVYKNKSASEVLLALADDFLLSVGDVDDTGTKLSAVEDNASILDIVYNALDETTAATGEMYVLFDDYGRLCLKSLGTQAVGILIDENAGQNFDYTSSIDDGVYNQVKLVYNNADTGRREVYIARDGKNIEKWGLLQHFGELKAPAMGQFKADTLLSLYNQKRRSLSIKGVMGDFRVRAGKLVAVRLALGDVSLEQFMLVEACTHRISADEHTMDLKLRGGDING